MTDYFPPGRLGGVGEIAAALRDAYRRRGIEVRVVTTGVPADGEEGVSRVAGGPAALGAISPLLPLRFGGVDLLHVHHASVPGLYLAKALLGDRMPAVVTTFQCSSREEMRQVRARSVGPGIRVRPSAREYAYKIVTGPLHCVADRMAMRLSDAVTAVCGTCLADCRASGCAPRGGLWKVPNGVDTGRFRPGAGGGSLRESFGVGKGFLILYVGALRLRKGVHDLLPALREVASRRADARLLVVGGGRGYEEPLREMAGRLGVEDRVILAPPVENRELPAIYEAADVVVIPSLFEGLPLVLLEAMAMGRPVVASRVDGIREVVRDGVNGILVPPGDPAAIARGVEEIAASESKARRMGREARRLVEERYSWDRIAGRYLEIFRRWRGRGQ